MVLSFIRNCNGWIHKLPGIIGHTKYQRTVSNGKILVVTETCSKGWKWPKKLGQLLGKFFFWSHFSLGPKNIYACTCVRMKRRVSETCASRPQCCRRQHWVEVQGAGEGLGLAKSNDQPNPKSAYYMSPARSDGTKNRFWGCCIFLDREFFEGFYVV